MLSLMALSSRSTRRQLAQKGPQHQAIGRSHDGQKTKIIALVNALGNLVRSPLLPGQAHEMKGVAPLIKGVSFDALFADKTNRKLQRDYDANVYKWHHLVENDFAKINEFRAIATIQRVTTPPDLRFVGHDNTR